MTQVQDGTGRDSFRKIRPGKRITPEKIKVCSMILGFIIIVPKKKPLEWALFLAETEVRPSTLEMSKRVAHANGVSILTFVSFL
ncbi:hypothetical protein [Algoriphagus faecimaris]|uniref:hypothetical protein n=1 Tax=Algoriphagus faecimaris TaxID=686796 RepID=UPI0011146143|nr:hypothetical protein [Algoriphagus faecimaris]